jgi:hypothetical protein
MPVTAPDPHAVRAASLQEVARLGLPVPPDNFPLVWDAGDAVELRPTVDLERRAAILYVILERAFGMPPDLASQWLEVNDLTPDVTEPEWAWITEDMGDRRSFILHYDAVAALVWVLGLVKVLDPLEGAPSLAALMPDLEQGESFLAWQGRTLSAPRDPAIVAAALDLHYCLDYGYLKLEGPLPGVVDANAIGQRRWALEWSCVFSGPHHAGPPGWEEVDLST